MKILKNKKFLTAMGIFFFLFMVAVLGGNIWIINFGFNNSYPCKYTQTKVEVLPVIKNAQLVLEKDIYVGTGKQPTECSWIMKLPNKELIDSNDMDKEYYENKGQKISLLSKGKTFEILGAISERKHGIETMDSGPDAGVSLLLRDVEGNEYMINEAWLGYDDKEANFGYYRNGKREGALTWIMMKDYYK